MSTPRILVVDDEAIVCESLGAWLRDDGFVVDVASSGHEAIELARAHSYCVVLLDIRMPGMDGIETLRELRSTVPDMPVVMMTVYADVSTAVASLKAGAYDYVTKPFDPDEISQLVRQLLQRQDTTGTLAATVKPGSESWSYADFAGSSPAMARAVQLAQKAAQTNISILIVGERGVGKECLARAIHGHGPRRHGPFVSMHCGTLSEAVLEVELFGHEQGTLPGMPAAKKGRLELADRGAVFLDEVEALSQRLQVVVLQVIEDRTLARLGGDAHRPVDLRWICATSENLEERVRAGTFLRLLFEQISPTIITIPPLRERTEDVPLLAERLLSKHRTEIGKDVRSISPEAIDALIARSWPGNIRELSRVIQRAIVVCAGSIVVPEDLARSDG